MNTEDSSRFVLFFNRDSYQESRNYEQLLIERSELDTSFFEEIESNVIQSDYDIIFEKIKEKLYNGVTTTLDESKIVQLSEKYNINHTKSLINNFKQNISILYNKKIELEITISQKKKLYNQFCDSITESINCIKNIHNEPDTEDTKLISLLSERLEWYYNELGLYTLIESLNETEAEFYFLKSTLADLAGLNCPSTCSICMENQVSWYINPCGHTLCENCKNKCEGSIYCHYCRNKISKYNRLYI